MSLHQTDPEVWEDAPTSPPLEFHDDCFGVIRTEPNGNRYCDTCGADV